MPLCELVPVSFSSHYRFLFFAENLISSFGPVPVLTETENSFCGLWAGSGSSVCSTA